MRVVAFFMLAGSQEAESRTRAAALPFVSLSPPPPGLVVWVHVITIGIYSHHTPHTTAAAASASRLTHRVDTTGSLAMAAVTTMAAVAARAARVGQMGGKRPMEVCLIFSLERSRVRVSHGVSILQEVRPIDYCTCPLNTKHHEGRKVE